MTTTPALTHDIGQAEHTMRALLERLLDEAGLSFPEWTVLIFLDGAGSLSLSELVQRQVDGRVVPEAAARATVDGLLSRGLLAPADEAHGAGGPGGDGEDPRLAPTAAGEAVYRPARRTVARITDELYGDLPPADLEATHRTLAEVTSRAFARLSGVSSSTGGPGSSASVPPKAHRHDLTHQQTHHQRKDARNARDRCARLDNVLRGDGDWDAARISPW